MSVDLRYKSRMTIELVTSEKTGLAYPSPSAEVAFLDFLYNRYLETFAARLDDSLVDVVVPDQAMSGKDISTAYLWATAQGLSHALKMHQAHDPVFTAVFPFSLAHFRENLRHQLDGHEVLDAQLVFIQALKDDDDNVKVDGRAGNAPSRRQKLLDAIRTWIDENAAAAAELPEVLQAIRGEAKVVAPPARDHLEEMEKAAVTEQSDDGEKEPWTEAAGDGETGEKDDDAPAAPQDGDQNDTPAEEPTAGETAPPSGPTADAEEAGESDSNGEQTSEGEDDDLDRPDGAEEAVDITPLPAEDEDQTPETPAEDEDQTPETPAEDEDQTPETADTDDIEKVALPNYMAGLDPVNVPSTEE